MSKPKPDPRPFLLLVDHNDGPSKAIGFWTAKAARLEAKRLAGIKGVAAIGLLHNKWQTLLWEAGR